MTTAHGRVYNRTELLVVEGAETAKELLVVAGQIGRNHLAVTDLALVGDPDHLQPSGQNQDAQGFDLQEPRRRRWRSTLMGSIMLGQSTYSIWASRKA